MKFTLLLLLVSFASFPVVAQMDTALCESLKVGNFAYRNDSTEAVLIRRTDKNQEEIINQARITTKFKIRWLSPCSYEIQQVWSSSRKHRKYNGSKTVVMITAVTKDHYTYTCACSPKGNLSVKTGTVYRVP